MLSAVLRSRIIFMRAPAPGKNFDADRADPAAPAPAPFLLYSKTNFLKQTKV
jgi:hypothetical protein